MKLIKNIIDSKKISETGKYVLAIITDYNFSARGTTYSYEYIYDEKNL